MARSTALACIVAVLALVAVVSASSGDRNPTFQHCLRGCSLTYCDPSQPPIPAYLRLFGWTCESDCQYQCAQSFTDHIRPGSRWHQFYGKWPFYRLGPIQEPFSVAMSLGNLYVNLQGVNDMRRRVRPENQLRQWLLAAGIAQVNTWLWSAVFHTRDLALTERLDYFSATITVATTLIYAIVRVLGLQTPLGASRLRVPAVAIVVFAVLSHFTYLVSFPLGKFPYGYHTKFVLVLALVQNLLWVAWSTSFLVQLPTLHILGREIKLPQPYPPSDPLQVRSRNAMTPLILVLLTTLAMSFELLDFRPIIRVIDAHGLWHAFTIPLAIGWWAYLTADAIELEGSLMGQRGPTTTTTFEKMPLSGGAPPSPKLSNTEEVRTPTLPAFAQFASMGPPPRRSPARSPGKAERQD